VGLSSGSLRVYRINEHLIKTNDYDKSNTDAPPPRSTELLQEYEKLSKRSIQQLAVIRPSNTLVILTDNHVCFHDLLSGSLQEKLEKTRGATLFSIAEIPQGVTQESEAVTYLAVGVKRKVSLWTWRGATLEVDVKEFVFPATVKSMTWVHKSAAFVVGMDPGFTLVEVDTSQMTEINKPVSGIEAAGQTLARFGAVNTSGINYMGMSGWVPKPMSTALTNGTMLLAKDVNTLFIDDKGKALDRRQIPWANGPEELGYVCPFLITLQPTAKGVLDVRNPETLTLLQRIPLVGASSIYPGPDGTVILASDRTVWRLRIPEFRAQIEELVEKSKYDEAISLLTQLEEAAFPDRDKQIREVRIQKAKFLFEQQKYRDSLDLFTDASAPPETVIALYPEVIASKLAERSDPQSKTSGLEASNDGDTIPPANKATDKIKTIADNSDTASIRSSNSVNKTEQTGSGNLSSSSNHDGANLKQAVLALCSFLAHSRVQVQKHMSFDGKLKDESLMSNHAKNIIPPFHNLIQKPEECTYDMSEWTKKLYEVARLVDTTLFRAYMFALPSLAGPLFRLDNFCDAKVVEEKLYETGRYNDLIIFLQGKKLHQEALQLLQQFGQNKAEEEVMPALRGPARTVEYLQQLPANLIDVILEFSVWPLKTDPERGMRIFMTDTEIAESLPRDKVLSHLDSIDHDLSYKYLEHIVLELNDNTPAFHQTLINTFISRMKINASGLDQSDIQAKLELFLRQSIFYNKNQTFRQLPTDDSRFYEARAIVYKAMGNHKEALSIYVFRLKDFEKAEAYCDDIYSSGNTRQTSIQSARPSPITPTSPPPSSLDGSKNQEDNIYLTLLSLYLRPPPHETVNRSPALNLLAKYGSRIPSTSLTLDLIPNDQAVFELQDYFRSRMRRELASRNEIAIVKGLEGVRRGDVECDLVFGKSQPTSQVEKGRRSVTGKSQMVIVGEEDHCKVCLKRFGNAAVKLWPDGEMVHYGCGMSGQRLKKEVITSEWT